MINQFESIKIKKFKVIPNNQLSKVLGQQGTGKGSITLKTEKRPGEEGEAKSTYIRRTMLNFESDEKSADGTCYFNTTTTISDWEQIVANQFYLIYLLKNKI